MTSLRKKVSSYFRQLSFHNEPRERKSTVNENSFITKYLTGEIKLKDGPPVLYGKTPNDLPNFEIGEYSTGARGIVGCSTGPNGGLTTVKRVEKHLSITDPDIDFIDTQEEIVVDTKLKPQLARNQGPLDNSTMAIKVAGQTYQVCNRKSRSLGSLTDLTAPEEGPAPHNNNNETGQHCKNKNPDDEAPEKSYPLSKSKSECSPFEHRKQGKIIRLATRPQAQGGQDTNDNPSQSDHDECLPKQWNRKTDFVYGLSDSLYDMNQVTKCKNGNPIADCYGIIARDDSAILALADGVNWGEKACIAAKSAIHGCLHYLNKTLFEDASLFDFDAPPAPQNSPIHTSYLPPSSQPSEPRLTNTTEVFVSLLRAFNCAHNLILENQGMLTTLTVAVVLPLKTTRAPPRGEEPRKYICCVCNVGDTLAYVYSTKFGVREITKGSHDVYCNRDMRDALGALGPVDGINPELNNLTLSVTTLDAGDIVMIASDGLTDNYDPTVCKYTVNCVTSEAASRSNRTRVQPEVLTHRDRPPIRASRDHKPNRKSSISSSKLSLNQPSTKIIPPTNVSRLAKDHQVATTSKSDSQNKNKENSLESNPLIAQFVRDNNKSSKPVLTNSNKPINPLSKSNSTSRVPKTVKSLPNAKYNFLRSKTSIDLRPIAKSPPRNEDGIPYVTPIQKYELTLLLIEDILTRGISGRDSRCLTAKILCENLLRYTVSVTAAKRHTLEDTDLYFDVRNDVLVEVSQKEKKLRRKRGLEKVQGLPGKLDHVSVVAYNVGNRTIEEG